MKSSKRIGSLFLCLCMVLALLPAPAMAAGDEIVTPQANGEAETREDAWDGSNTTISTEVTWTIDSAVTQTGTVTISSGGKLTLTGTGTILRDGTFNNGDMFQVNSGGTLVIDGVTIDGDNVSCSSERAIYVSGGTVTMKNGTIQNCVNTSSRGSAVYIHETSGGNFTMESGVIQNNQASGYGGAIYVDGPDTGTANNIFTLKGGTISGNKTMSSLYGGGAIYNRDTVIIEGGAITNNSSSGSSGRGGGIYNSSYGELTITNGTISGNTAAGNGDGIFHSSQEGNESVLEIDGAADIQDEIYLDGDEAEKVVTLLSALQYPLTVVCGTTAEDRVIADAAAGYTITNQDMARFSVVNEGWYFKLDTEDNQIQLTQQPSAAFLPVKLTSDDGGLTVKVRQETWSAGDFVILTYDAEEQGYTGNLTAGRYQVYVGDDTSSVQTITITGTGNNVFRLEYHRHSCTYTVNGNDGNVLTESCGETGCGHSATATLAVNGGPFTYTGSTYTPATLTYSDNWTGGTNNGGIQYSGNADAGTATASVIITVNGQQYTVQANFTIEPAELTGVTVAQSGALIYTGVPLTAAVTTSATSVNGQTVTFTYSAEQSGTYSTTVPTFTDAGDHTVYYKASAPNHKETSGSFTVAIGHKSIEDETDTLTITGNTEFGETLTAKYTGGANGEALSYQWQRSDGNGDFTDITGATGATYKLTADDIGHTIRVVISGKGNYSGSVTSEATGTVSKKTLTPSVENINDKTYDGTTDATGTISLSGIVTGDTVTAAGTFTFENANAGENKSVNVTNITLSGVDSEKYSLSTTSLTGTANITKRIVTLQWSGYTDLTYDGQQKNVTATAGNLVGNEVCTVTVTGGTETNAGTHTATATQPSNDNYQLPNETTCSYTIIQRPIKYTVENLDTLHYTYDGQPHTATVTVENVLEKDGTIHTVNYRTQYYNGTSVTDAESYDVIVVLNNTNYRFDSLRSDTRELDTGVDLTINPKTLTATWDGLSQTYGSSKTVTVDLFGVVDGDEDTVKVTFAYKDDNGSDVANPANVGTYAVTANLTGDGAGNYRLLNSGETLTIYAAPVSFTVTGNAVQHTGNSHKATVTPSVSLTSSDYTVTYRNSAGDEVDAPTDVGSYAIWVTITNANYRHASGTANSQQVGTLTISSAAPREYAVTFNENGSTGGTVPSPGTQTAGAVFAIPDGKPTRENYAFAGWTCGGAVYQPGDTFTMPAGSVTFTAQWEPVHTVSGTVVAAGGSGGGMEGVTVTLKRGATVIDTETTGVGGTFSFDVPAGLYNLVAQYEGITVTRSIELTGDSTDNAITLPQGMTNSVVTVAEDTPVTVVGRLDTVFIDTSVYTEDDQAAVDTGGIVEVELTASTPDSTAQNEIVQALEASEAVNQSAALGLFLDLTVKKTVTPVSGTQSQKTIDDTGVLLETYLTLPAELQGKASYTVYRIHETGEGQTEVQALTTSPNADGESIELADDGTVLVIRARYYSSYVVAYTERTPSSGGYRPSIEDTANGTVSVSPARPYPGQTVTITPRPDAGYAADEITVTGPNGTPVTVTDNGDGTWSFTQPAGSVTISVTFRAAGSVADCPRDETCPMARFTDVNRDAWYHDGVHYCLEKGLMVGTGESIFEPEAATSRGMIVTILWRLEGEPAAGTASGFEDVDAGAWFAEAVAWAAENGIVEGYGGGAFFPDSSVTREQLAAILHRYAVYKGYDVSAGEDTNILSYTDFGDLSEYAIPAMQWACGAGIINGTSESTLTPQGEAARAQVAAMLMRFCEAAA